MHILINAIHAKAGGGVVYLNSLLPYLAQLKGRHKITVLCHVDYANKLRVPSEFCLASVRPPRSFIMQHLWEQFVLPFRIRAMNVDFTLNNANYGPLLAPRSSIIILNNPTVHKFTRSFKQKMYWYTLIWLTRICLMRAPVAFANARYIVPHYTLKNRYKIKIAYPACEISSSLGSKVRRYDHILTIGDHYVQKNYPMLIDAFALLLKQRPEMRLTIAGRPIDKNVYKAVKNGIKKHGIEGNVDLEDFIPHSELLGRLQRCTLFISPSLAESFSLTVLEAMSMGAPTVALDEAFQHEVGKDNILYCQNTPESMSKTMLRIIDDENLGDRLSQMGRTRASEFSWDKTAKLIMDNINRFDKSYHLALSLFSLKWVVAVVPL